MNNWMQNCTDANIKEKLEEILNQVLAEKQDELRTEVVTRFFELLGTLAPETIDTHGLEMRGLTEAAQALKENPELTHTIFYDVKEKEVYVRANNVRGMQDDIDLLSPSCPYVCRVYRGQGMTAQEIADKISEAVERNIMMALLDSKYRTLAEEEKAELLYTREGIRK